MKKYLEKLIVFKFGLSIFSFFALRKFNGVVRFFTDSSAWLNLMLNQPTQANNARELAETWVDLMPPDGRDLFKISSIDEDTAYVEIHLHCPLRGTGDVEACHHLMNYDRKLMENVGGNLIVLASQSNSGKPYCQLAIRKKGLAIDDLIPAHKNPNLKLK